MADSTQSESRIETPRERLPVPGLLLVFSEHAPQYRPIPIPSGKKTLVLGREDIGGLPVPDKKVGRAHAEVRFEDGWFVVTDLDSRNGTFLDGVRISGTVRARAGAVLRLHRTVLVLHDDLQRFIMGRVRVEDGFVVGPGLQEALDLAAMARRGGMHLLVHGESGSGKELVAQTYHQSWTPRGPLKSINAATIGANMAERTLFGCVKGAFTDAKQDEDGMFTSADGGVLFLDEVAEIDAKVQASLLRVAQSGEFHPLGTTVEQKVDVRIVSASHQNLRTRVSRGEFREDLLFRLAASEVSVRPLRERREELPWLMQLVLGDAPQRPLHATVVEQALLRPWPGNVRELLTETKHARQNAELKDSDSIRAEHLREIAGQPITSAPTPAPRAPLAGAAPQPRAPSANRERLTKEQVEEALAANDDNATRTAKALGLHREQLNRLRRDYGLVKPRSPSATLAGDDPDAEAEADD